MTDMEFFAHDDEVVPLLVGLPPLPDVSCVPALVTLAWYHRQRDASQALVWVAQGRALLAGQPGQSERASERKSELEPKLVQKLLARCLLIEAEVNWLKAENDEAAALATSALASYVELTDSTGCADCHWVLSRIANDCGDSPGGLRHVQLMQDYAQQSGDVSRQCYADVGLAAIQAFSVGNVGFAKWRSAFELILPQAHPAVQVVIHGYFGVCASLQSDFGGAATQLVQAYELARSTGQIRDMICNAVNLGDAFSSLNDHQTALEWMQRGLDMARDLAWPVTLGLSLGQTADVLRHLGRLDAARELLDEAKQALSPVGVSRYYAIVFSYSGDFALDSGDYALAMTYFEELVKHADYLHQLDFKTTAWRGQAHALLKLGQVPQALRAIHMALDMARSQHDSYSQIRIFQVLADIYSRHHLPLPQAEGVYPPLYYLLQILPLAASIKGYTLAGDVLDAIANAYAATGDYVQAFQFTQKANVARESTHSLVAKNRAIAMQVRYQIERATANNEYHQQLAIAEAKRVAVLAETNAILARLGAVGQEITAQLQTDAVFAALSRNVHGLLDTSSFTVYLVAPDGESMSMAFGIEGGKPLPPLRIVRDDPYSNAARSWREGTDILIYPSLSEDDPALIPGTVFSLSRLFAPLVIGTRILGVMSVQSEQRYAYGVSERFIFRTLCAYGAIALENSHAYQQLEMAQAQVVEQEKLAALGRLVAGVAHELNTPVGNCLMMSSDLHQKADLMDGRMQQRNMKYRDLTDFLDDSQYAVTVVIRGLTHAADLVNSFKQVAVDRTTAHQRVFNLQQTCHDVVATMMNHIKLAGHQIELDIPPMIILDSYPGPFGQVISNFISNVLAHAFPTNSKGYIRLAAEVAPLNRVRITFSDNGAGIAEADLKRIFEPFFAGSQGGNGLGLSISYNIVTSLLNGKIWADSTLGSGTLFTLDLPLIVDATHE